MVKAETDHGPDNCLETYYSPKEEVEIQCSTDEREDFERDTNGHKITQDVLTDWEFLALLLFLRKEKTGVKLF